VGASISDAVGGSFALEYPFAVLSFNAPVYGCARPAAKGVNMFPSMMADARIKGGTGELCLPELYTCGEGGSLNYELSLFNAIVVQCDRRDLGVRRDEREGCGMVATGVRNALWLMAGREGEFKWGRVPKRFEEYAKPLDEGGFGVFGSRQGVWHPFWVILSGLYVIFFWKDQPQSEGSRYTDLGIKSPPAYYLPPPPPPPPPYSVNR
jgi:hypothetical protein